MIQLDWEVCLTCVFWSIHRIMGDGVYYISSTIGLLWWFDLSWWSHWNFSWSSCLIFVQDWCSLGCKFFSVLVILLLFVFLEARHSNILLICFFTGKENLSNVRTENSLLSFKLNCHEFILSNLNYPISQFAYLYYLMLHLRMYTLTSVIRNRLVI